MRSVVPPTSGLCLTPLGIRTAEINSPEVFDVADTRRLPGPVAEIWDWQLRSLCRDMDSAVFFHPDRERGNARMSRETQAKAICHRCPVLRECREHALRVHEPYGIWGAMTAQERKVVIAERGGGAAALHTVRDRVPVV